jgi:hypothetical protein
MGQDDGSVTGVELRAMIAYTDPEGEAEGGAQPAGGLDDIRVWDLRDDCRVWHGAVGEHLVSSRFIPLRQSDSVVGSRACTPEV